MSDDATPDDRMSSREARHSLASLELSPLMVILVTLPALMSASSSSKSADEEAAEASDAIDERASVTEHWSMRSDADEDALSPASLADDGEPGTGPESGMSISERSQWRAPG